MKNFLDEVKGKPVGFYLTFATAIWGLITAIVYACCFHDDWESMSWPAFALLLVAVAAYFILFFLRQVKLAPVTMAVLNGIAFMFFAYGIYYYISVVLVGIDEPGFSAEFIVSVVFFAILIVLSIVNIFLKVDKTEDDQEKESAGDK